ncbi:hypothetical protein TPY_0384 [Sulfobacillus acidophilus TPY]|uniref:Uncharacterized protein n=1 Tax=Sulfobacillus acidophilus (strain ATCC 700253 / DSM 10332 / NAL) TaxID=679936 RepID=G8TY11_SULAD|nr:hypothetical protein TPY_0384 [Sulfobacillus acidophilus TPY]AEW03918.1 hypothetical protein Sulac_0349 [Sulfobacillus acidophilus DSM 10332]MCY0863891.1 hypothetical protein [Sulfobacillus sp.]
MREQVERLLIYLGRTTMHLSWLQLIIGYLLSDPGRVRFVPSLDGTPELAMMISAHRRIEVPGPPWQGYVRGVPVPDPLTWIQVAKSMTVPIDVRLSSDDPILLQMLTPLVAPVARQHERLEVEERMQSLRTELDRALDLYNEVRHIMEVDHERHQELEKFLGLAEAEMQKMGQELKRLKSRMDEETSG